MWKQIWEQYKGTSIGVLSGIFFGFIYLFFGLWDMLIFVFLVFIGYYVGKKADQRETLWNGENLWHWLSERWRMFR